MKTSLFASVIIGVGFTGMALSPLALAADTSTPIGQTESAPTGFAPSEASDRYQRGQGLVTRMNRPIPRAVREPAIPSFVNLVDPNFVPVSFSVDKYTAYGFDGVGGWTIQDKRRELIIVAWDKTTRERTKYILDKKDNKLTVISSDGRSRYRPSDGAVYDAQLLKMINEFGYAYNHGTHEAVDYARRPDIKAAADKAMTVLLREFSVVSDFEATVPSSASNGPVQWALKVKKQGNNLEITHTLTSSVGYCSGHHCIDTNSFSIQINLTNGDISGMPLNPLSSPQTSYLDTVGTYHMGPGGYKGTLKNQAPYFLSLDTTSNPSVERTAVIIARMRQLLGIV